jgi:hypothetical protein
MIYAFTSSAGNYYPKVKLLRDSIREHSPQIKFIWLVADRYDEALEKCYKSEFDEMIFASDISAAKNEDWLFCHNLVELATAIKPYAAEMIMKKDDCDGVVYYDPDMVLFSNVDEIYKDLDKYNILLTPHLTKPEVTDEAVLDNEVCSLRHGVFNLGFFAVKNSIEGRAYLAWWRERLYKYCSADLSKGFFTDQKWINFAPVFFDGVKILKDTRFNVAPWNLAQRTVTGNIKEGIRVDGNPLGFYHFTGFDSGAHELMAFKYGKNIPGLWEIITWYKKEGDLGSIGKDLKWRLGFYSSGEKIKPTHRNIYKSRPDLKATFKNPYDASSSNSFYSWLKNHGNQEFPNEEI